MKKARQRRFLADPSENLAEHLAWRELKNRVPRHLPRHTVQKGLSVLTGIQESSDGQTADQILILLQPGTDPVSRHLEIGRVLRRLAAHLVQRCLYILAGVSGLLMTSSAYFGIRALRIISIIAVPSIAVFGGWSALKALFFDDPAFIVRNNAALAGQKISSGWQALVNHVPAVDPKTGASAAIGMVLSAGDTVLLKASHGMNLGSLI